MVARHITEQSTADDVKEFLLDSNRSASKKNYRILFGLDKDELKEATRVVGDMLAKHYDTSKGRLPGPGKSNQHFPKRLQLEIDMHNQHPELFSRRQNAPAHLRPAWYFDQIYITGREKRFSQKDHESFGMTAGMLFQGVVFSELKKKDNNMLKIGDGLAESAKAGHDGSPLRRRARSASRDSATSSAALPRHTKRIRLDTPREEPIDDVMFESNDNTLATTMIHLGFVYLDKKSRLRIRHRVCEGSDLFTSEEELKDWSTCLEALSLPQLCSQRFYGFQSNIEEPHGRPATKIGLSGLVKRLWLHKPQHVSIFHCEKDHYILDIPENMRNLDAYLTDNAKITIRRGYTDPVHIPHQYRSTDSDDDVDSQDDVEGVVPPDVPLRCRLR